MTPKNGVIYDITLFYRDRFREGDSDCCYFPDDPDLPSFSLSKQTVATNYGRFSREGHLTCISNFQAHFVF